MIKIKNLKHCSGCLACVQACPASAIATVKENGFVYPKVDGKKCIDCGKCEQVCAHFHPLPTNRNESAYIAYTDEAVRRKSSAGGVFAILALRTLAVGGVVFGSAYDADGRCVHKWVDDADGLYELVGRKYVVSDPADTYKKVKEFLLEEREVLFSGTPCQVAGLKGYLGAPFVNLLTVEVGCGGVAGEDVWHSFLRLMNNPKEVSITDRVEGENNAAISFVYENGEELVLARKDTAIHRAITLGLGIRPSCESCTMGKKRSLADITLRRYNPAIDDSGLNIRRQPMTMVICRSAAGSRAFAESATMLNIKEITRDDAYRHIYRAEKEKRCADRSGAFIRSLDELAFDKALEKYSKKGFFSGFVKGFKSIYVK